MDNLTQVLSTLQNALLAIKRTGGKSPYVSIHILEKLQAVNVQQKPCSSTMSPLITEKQSSDITLISSLPISQESEEKWTLASLHKRAQACVQCTHLVAHRTQVVFGTGNPKAELMFVGEAPGIEEDCQGEPFVGRAGRLLTRIIETMGFSREEVYITNVLKCRPDTPTGFTGNRKPTSEEMIACFPWLHGQITLVNPRVLVALGATAAGLLCKTTQPMKALRGQWTEYYNIPVLVTYHPAYLLRNRSLQEKRKVWQDMLLVLEKLGRPISEKQKGYFLTCSGE